MALTFASCRCPIRACSPCSSNAHQVTVAVEQRDFRRVAGLLAGALSVLRDQSGPVVQRAIAASVLLLVKRHGPALRRAADSDGGATIVGTLISCVP
jgi:hypothetical protein